MRGFASMTEGASESPSLREKLGWVQFALDQHAQGDGACASDFSDPHAATSFVRSDMVCAPT